MEFKKTTNINISTLTIVKIFLIILFFYFLYLVKDVLVSLFVSLILASAINPWVDWMRKKRVPRALGIIFIYAALFIIISSIIYLIIPPIAQQISELAINFPRYIEKITSSFSVFKEYANDQGILDNIKNNLGIFSSNLQGAAGGVFSTVSGIFGGIFSFFLVLVITFYMVVEESAMKKIVWSIAPSQHQPYIMQLIMRMQRKIGLWLRGQLILSIIIFILTFSGLLILGVDYALVLALIAGLTEFVPYLGPLLAAIPAIFLAFTQSPMLALFVAILYYIIQIVENNIIVPKLMEKVIGLNPIVSIVVLLMGFKIAGIMGAILAIPVATAAGVFLGDLFKSKMAQREKAEKEN